MLPPLPRLGKMPSACEHTLAADKGLDHVIFSIYRLLREAEGAEVGAVFGTGARALVCHRGGAFGEEASCATLYFAH
jgi:hypothetical protein